MCLSVSTERMSTLRKLALAVPVAWIILVLLAFGGPLSLMKKLVYWPLAYAIALGVVNALVGAVYIVELLRVLIHSGATWSDTR